MWTCAIEACGYDAERAEDLLVHQATEHDRLECAVCGESLLDGYFAIRHAFDDHSRVEYVRAYDADADQVRHREDVLSALDASADLDEVMSRIEGHVDDPRA